MGLITFLISFFLDTIIIGLSFKAYKVKKKIKAYRCLIRFAGILAFTHILLNLNWITEDFDVSDTANNLWFAWETGISLLIILTLSHLSYGNTRNN